jgi:hydroxyacylglutathione hydrolase
MPITSEILPGLFFVERGYLNGNHLVAPPGEMGDRSGKATLVDTGYETGWPRTEKALAALGVTPEKVGLIVCTHAHCDHVGGNRRIQEASGCGVAMHPEGRRWVEARDARRTWTSFYDLKADWFTPTRTLADGETLALGAHEFTVLHTPGHTADSVCLYNRRARLLVSADSLWENDLALTTTAIEGEGALDLLRASLDRMEGLEVSTVLPGHGRPFTAFREALAEARKRLKRLRNDPRAQGTALLRKMVIFQLLIYQGETGIAVEEYRRLATRGEWFLDAKERFLGGGDADEAFRATIDDLARKGAVTLKDGKLMATARN